MENTKRHLQTKEEAHWQEGCRIIDSGSSTGVLLDGTRYRDVRRNTKQTNRLEWRC